MNADGYLIGNRIITPFGPPIPNPVATGSGFITDYRMNDLRSGNAGDRYRDGLNMYAWFAQHGATNADGLPFTPGNRIRGEQMSNGDIQFKAFKNGQPFTTAWSSDYFMPEHVEAMPIYSNEQIDSSLLAGYGNYDPNPVGSVAAEAAALAAQDVQFSQAEGSAGKTKVSVHIGGSAGKAKVLAHIGNVLTSPISASPLSQSQIEALPIGTKLIVTKTILNPAKQVVFPAGLILKVTSITPAAIVYGVSSPSQINVSWNAQPSIGVNSNGYRTENISFWANNVALAPNYANAEGDATTTTAPVNPILAPEMITADKKGGMKICLPCTGSIIGLALGLGAAYYVTKHPALSKFHLKNNILQYSVYGLAVGALGYGIGLGINKLK